MSSSSATQDNNLAGISDSNRSINYGSNNSSSSGSSSSGEVDLHVPVSAEPVPLKVDKKDGFAYTAGPALVSGASQAILFNPIDRALYVRVKFRRRHFLDKRNFERPFQGFMNAAVYRTLVGASYMFWQDSMRIAIERLAPARCQASVSPQLNSMLIGLSAGSVNGFALNTLQAVKFRMWNTDERGITFVRTALNMYKEGGIAIFFRGCITTMVRDSVFGVVYETTRRAAAWRQFFERQVAFGSSLLGKQPLPSPALADAALPESKHDSAKESKQRSDGEARGETAKDNKAAFRKEKFGLAAFLSNLMAALTASMMSSPFNYVRSIVYGTPAGAIPLGYMPLLKSFYTQFYYIYRHGRSYTDRHGMPELCETEHRAAPRAAGGASANSTTQRPRVGRSTGASEGSAAHKASSGGAPSVPRRRPALPSSVARMSAAVRLWSDTHRHHPFAAWTWANSRLNIGWGSIRVGLGMAMGQSLFYLAQDLAREDKHRTARV